MYTAHTMVKTKSFPHCLVFIHMKFNVASTLTKFYNQKTDMHSLSSLLLMLVIVSMPYYVTAHYFSYNEVANFCFNKWFRISEIKIHCLFFFKL